MIEKYFKIDSTVINVKEYHLLTCIRLGSTGNILNFLKIDPRSKITLRRGLRSIFKKIVKIEKCFKIDSRVIKR